MKGTVLWHWCRNCSKWPVTDFESVYLRPDNGEMDRECREKEEAGDCRNY